jgi:Fe-S-cluster containining protein
MLVTDLLEIAKAAEKNEMENCLFKQKLLAANSNSIDDLVFKLNKSITAQIDCTVCGNCCQSLMINVDDNDAERLAGHLQLTREAFETKYIERSSEGTLAVMNTIPCNFLHCNKCDVYEARPNECREFPGLHHPHFTKRLFATFMHYGRCPIVYNVIEALKKIASNKEREISAQHG